MRSTELDVLIMDLALPGQSGFEALARIRATSSKPAILIFTGYPQDQCLVNAFRQGASAFLNKPCEPREIANAINVIAKGGRYITSEVADGMAARLDQATGKLHESLSDRDFQILLKLAPGCGASSRPACRCRRRQ